jgi:mycofactocin precursor
MTEPTTHPDDSTESDEETATELLVEEVSIDGLCGVY